MRKSLALSQSRVARVRRREDVHPAVGGGHGDRSVGGVLLERRIDVVRQRLEQREVRERRDQAAEHDDPLAADPVREPAEDDEERRSDDERRRR